MSRPLAFIFIVQLKYIIPATFSTVDQQFIYMERLGSKFQIRVYVHSFSGMPPAPCGPPPRGASSSFSSGVRAAERNQPGIGVSPPRYSN